MKIELTIPKDKIGFSKTVKIQKPEARTSNDEECKRLKSIGLPVPDFFLYVVGASGSGKTTLIQKLLNDSGKNRKYRKVFHKIYWISPSTHTLSDDLKIPEDQIYDSVDALPEILEKLDSEEFNLIVLDDCIMDINNSAFFAKFMTRYRHYGCSIIVISQAYNALFRRARLNNPHVILFPCAFSQVQDLVNDRFGKEMEPEVMYNICKEIWKKRNEEEHIRPFLYLNRDNQIHRNFTPLIYRVVD